MKNLKTSSILIKNSLMIENPWDGGITKNEAWLNWILSQIKWVLNRLPPIKNGGLEY